MSTRRSGATMLWLPKALIAICMPSFSVSTDIGLIEKRFSVPAVEQFGRHSCPPAQQQKPPAPHGDLERPEQRRAEQQPRPKAASFARSWGGGRLWAGCAG